MNISLSEDTRRTVNLHFHTMRAKSKGYEAYLLECKELEVKPFTPREMGLEE